MDNSSHKALHIISFDIPYPADYGGVIDVYYKLKSLAALGVEITLHCFQYGKRLPQPHLETLCRKVYYYPRLTGWKGLHTSLPYIVSSRRDETLFSRLLEDDAPILFEGLHTTFYAAHVLLAGRIKLLRAHNVESDYYHQLAGLCPNYIKRMYYRLEADRLWHYERHLPELDAIFSISYADTAYFRIHHPASKSIHLPAFHAADAVTILPGSGTYCLFHGNLEMEENIRAAEYLAKEVFNDGQISFVIAGRRPHARVMRLQNKQIRVIANPDDRYMHQLIQEAHIHILPGSQQTGMKLKLIHALFSGRHCIIQNTQADPALRTLVHTAPDAASCRQLAQQLMQQPFSETDIQSREEVLQPYSNAVLAQNFLRCLDDLAD